MRELKDDHTFGRVQGVVYTIEFQKRGLPHCHILLWLEPQDKLTTTGKIDQYISAKILNKDEDPELYQLVTDHMMHGPGDAKNPSCPCTVDYKCTKKYLSTCEAAWHIYGFDIHYRTPSVERLPFHLKDEQHVIFDVTESIDYAVDKGPMEWADLKKVDNVLYPTYRDACYTRGLLQGDKEYIDGLLEASFWGMSDYLHSIFVMLIMTDSMSWPEVVWEKTWSVMAADVLSVERIKQGIPDLELSDIQRKNIFLTYIECMLWSNNMSLKDIPNMSYPDQEHMMDGYNRLIYDETSYNPNKLREQHATLYRSLTSEQKGIHSTVIKVVDNNKGGMFFVYGYGGTGKTYLYKTMSAALRSKGEIVLNVASSGIAALLLEGGRTLHSRFAISINVVEDSMCHIGADSNLVGLIRKAKLIIWDEAPMINRHCYKDFNRT
ncbi:ATP-dependent DNA helicase PIF1-like protein [Tanacetum coccineum]